MLNLSLSRRRFFLQFFVESLLELLEKNEKFLRTKNIFFSKYLGILAKDFHSVAFKQYSIYAWGTNGGQFGVANIDTSVPTKANLFYFSACEVQSIFRIYF